MNLRIRSPALLLFNKKMKGGVVKQQLVSNFINYQQRGLTFGEPWWIIVDIAERDVDGGGPGQPPKLAAHVLGLD